MDPEEIKKIQDALDASLGKMTTLVEQRDAELKTMGQGQEETAKKIAAMDSIILEQKAAMDAMTLETKDMRSKMDEAEAKAKRLGSNFAEEQKSLGQSFVESEAFKGYKLGDKLSKLHQFKSFHRKAGEITGASLGSIDGYMYQAMRMAGVVQSPNRTQRVRDLMNVSPTSSGAIEFVRETGFTNRADTVPEAPAGGKPQSALTYELESYTVRTVAHWLPVSRQVLDDVNQLRSNIDNRLLYGLMLAEDDQLLYGSGQGSDLQGIMTPSTGCQTYAWSESHVVTDTKIDAIRRAMTKCTVAEYPVDGIVLNPNDWEDIELLKNDDKGYIWVVVTIGGEKRLWRAPVVETNAINEGEFLTGAFSLGATLWDREQASIRISEDHASFFIQNLIAILAEERLVLTVERPEAFVIGDFDHVPVAGS